MSGKELGEALWTLGNDSARDPKRTKRADVLDEVKPRLSWGRSLDSRRVGGHDVGGFVNPTLKWEARLCEEGSLPRRGIANNQTAGWKSTRSFWL
ncbi:hypothetical protein EBR66_06510 [bacterium]|nr:hypothetical protein [bacterium]